MKVSEYSSSIPYRIAHVSDLHERKPFELLETLRSLDVDLIVVTGDTFERQKGSDPLKKSKIYRFLKLLAYAIIGSRTYPKRGYSYLFLKEASKIAPVYLSLGNHEWFLKEEDYVFLREHKITVLDNSYVRFGNIYIGGLSSKVDEEFLKEFKELEGRKLLLSHHPEYYKRYDLTGFDLVLSGHAHGGQMRLFGRGLYAPSQGFFPKITSGRYFGNLIVSAGVTNTLIIPRIGNPCEVVLISALLV